MPINLNNGIVNALAARLTANMPTYINAVNAEMTNPDFPLDQIQRVLDYIPVIADLSAFPVIGIADGDVMFHDDTGWGATGETTLSIVVFEQHADQRALAWRLRRLAIATTRCVLEGRTLPPEGWGVMLRRVRPGPTLGRDETPRQWMSTVTVQIDVKTNQDTP